MDMGMEMEVLTPTMQHGEEADRCTQMLGFGYCNAKCNPKIPFAYIHECMYNIVHIAAHDVTPPEVEEVFAGEVIVLELREKTEKTVRSAQAESPKAG
jgi:hypothetical protein